MSIYFYDKHPTKIFPIKQHVLWLQNSIVTYYKLRVLIALPLIEVKVPMTLSGQISNPKHSYCFGI